MIVSAQDVRESEQFTIKSEPISSVDLMERAAQTVVAQLMSDLDMTAFDKIVVVCGSGNNGGDGLVAARLLAEKGFPTDVILTHQLPKVSDEFLYYLKKIEDTQKQCNNLQCINFEYFKTNASLYSEDNILIIDAIFGIGLSRPVTDFYADVISFFNDFKNPQRLLHHLKTVIVAIDAPSGLFVDQRTPSASPRIFADITYTFQWMKWAYLLPENENCVGHVSVLDIGLKLPSEKNIHNLLIDKELVSIFYRPLRKFAHKGSHGHGLLVAGSRAMPGAAFLAATAAMRGGIGKLTVHTVDAVADILPVALPEAIIDRDVNPANVSQIRWERLAPMQALAIGPGLGVTHQTASLLKDIISEVHSPFLLDADALNILAENKTWLAFLPAYTILTPHFKEFERLAGPVQNDFERIEKLQVFSQKYNVIVVLKGAHSVVALPNGKLYVNTTGNPGMATAGSGDVLTGIILACLSKGYAPEIAAILGVYLHGKAGDLALEQESQESLIAGDICKNIGKAFHSLLE